MEVLLAACALRDGEARVPPGAFRDDTSMMSIALPSGYPPASRAWVSTPSMTASR
jgi:hypothetical protein